MSGTDLMTRIRFLARARIFLFATTSRLVERSI